MSNEIANICLELLAQDLSVNDYNYDEILEIVKESYELGRNANGNTTN
jgi:hypothetical protein